MVEIDKAQKMLSKNVGNKEIVIVGAGIAGLTAAYILAKKGYKVTVIEKENVVGGLARSFKYDGFTFDIGPHRFYAEDGDVAKFIEEILDGKARRIVRQSGVWMFGAYLDWPLKPNIIFALPPRIILRVFRDLLFRSRLEGNTFESYACNRYGKTLYNIFFKPYSEKFLNSLVSSIHADWIKESIERAIIDKNLKMNNLYEILQSLFISRQGRKSFLYPIERGVGAFSMELAKRIQDRGGTILVNRTVGEIRCNSPKIKELIVGQQTLRPDIVIWTAPLTILAKLLKIEPLGLQYLSLICYNLEVNASSETNYQWCYYGERDVAFSRVSIPALFSTKAAPEGRMGICVEVPCLEGNWLWQNPEVLVDVIKRDLVKTGQIRSPEAVSGIHIEKIPNSYPIYELNYPSKLDRFKGKVSRFNNLILLGRSGTFWYNNMDHSIKMAMDVAKKILRSK